jgi:hypothetical protein
VGLLQRGVYSSKCFQALSPCLEGARFLCNSTTRYLVSLFRRKNASVSATITPIVEADQTNVLVHRRLETWGRIQTVVALDLSASLNYSLTTPTQKRTVAGVVQR